MIKKIAIYGKGGIGKSTIASNLSISLAIMGYRVMQFGCDPKSDSTSGLRGGVRLPTVLDYLRDNPQGDIHKVIVEGSHGVFCVEAGGPTPGVGCAGRGIITAIEQFNAQNIFDGLGVDFVIFDVLGDVVCGGFAMPIRNHVADIVYTVSSSDFMSIYAANNLMRGIGRYANASGALFGGILANSVNADFQRRIIDEYAEMSSSDILCYVPRALSITKAELCGATVVEMFPDTNESKLFRQLAERIAEQRGGKVPRPCSDEELYSFSNKWSEILLNTEFDE